MIIKKTDISSIFPIIIKIIKLNLEVVNKFEKLISPIPNIGELVVFVIVKIDNLNDFSKSILSNIKIPERINKFIKKEFRDVTYFRGLDLHMDSIDWENANNKFITMYVYLNEVDHSMSPLEIVKGSHKLGHTQHPHYIEKIKNSNEIKYSLDNKKFLKFEKEKLVGASGSVYFWTSNTLHGTAESKESKESFRISLRYIIEKRKNSTGLIDKVIDQEKVGKTR